MGAANVHARVLGIAWLTCVGCGDPCAKLADQLRECCARGPAELRAGCEAEADALEDDGDADACENSLEQGTFEGCSGKED